MMSISRIQDVITFAIMYVLLTLSYPPKYSKGKTAAAICFFCVLGVIGTILEERAPTATIRFILYALNFFVWGGLYAHIFLQEQTGLKLAMTATYCVSSFLLIDCAQLIAQVMGMATTGENPVWRYLFIPFNLFIAGFLKANALHSKRQVSGWNWGAIVGAAFLNLLAYSLERHNWASITSAQIMFSRTCVGLFHLLVMYGLYFTISRLIRQYEQSLSIVSFESGKQTGELMSDELIRLNRELQKIRHESRHQVTAVAAMLKQGDVAAAKEYLTKLSHEPLTDSRTIHCGNVVVDAVLNQKASVADHENIPMKIEASLTSNLSISDVDLTALLSNLLSNAVEASRKAENPEIEVRIYPIRCYLCVVVRNKADLSALERNPELHTTKPDAALHGFGLTVVREIAERYNGGVSFETDEEGWFAAKVMLQLEDMPDSEKKTE